MNIFFLLYPSIFLPSISTVMPSRGCLVYILLFPMTENLLPLRVAGHLSVENFVKLNLRKGNISYIPEFSHKPSQLNSLDTISIKKPHYFFGTNNPPNKSSLKPQSFISYSSSMPTVGWLKKFPPWCPPLQIQVGKATGVGHNCQENSGVSPRRWMSCPQSNLWLLPKIVDHNLIICLSIFQTP